MNRARETPVAWRIAAAVRAAEAVRGHIVAGGGALGPANEIVTAPFDEVTGPEERQTGLHAASWALRHTSGHEAAAETLGELLHALGLKTDPLCDWEPRTASSTWGSRRRRRGDAA